MASVAGVLLAMLHPLLGIGALLFFYNTAHLTLRRRGFAAGMEGPEGAVDWRKRAARTGVAPPRRRRRAPVPGPLPEGGVAVGDPVVSSLHRGADPVEMIAEREFDILNRLGLHARAPGPPGRPGSRV